MKDDKQTAEDTIVKKLDKVAGSLESTTSQLSSVVTQQQLDVLRERISKIEGDASLQAEMFESRHTKLTESLGIIEANTEALEKLVKSIDKDHTATRALTYSGFVLGTLSIIGLVIFSLKL